MSIEKFFAKYKPVNQISFFCPDIEKAALRHNEVFGSGPWLIAPRCKFTGNYRGTPADLEIQTCYGTWGDMQVEFVQLFTPAPNYETDMIPEGQVGFNHTHMIVDDIAEAVAELNKLGYESAQVCERDGQLAFVMVDLIKDLGMMIEIYGKGNKVLPMMVANAAKNWDGVTEPIRRMHGA